jgi:trk system potassium uptake protein
MSASPNPSGRYDTTIRRRIRESQRIEMPQMPPLPNPRGVRDRAKTIALVLLGTILAGAILLATPFTTTSGERTPVVDAIFTSASAVAVTGLVTVDTGTHWNHAGQFVILVLIQIGGLGFMVGAGLLFQAMRGSRTSLHQSLMVQDGSPTVPLNEAVALARQIAVFTFVMEGVGWILLTMRFSQDMSLGSAVWHGLFHAISAFCNAGFDLQGDYRSLTGYRDSIGINAVVIALIQAGSLSFLVFRDVYQEAIGRIRNQTREGLSLDAKIVLTGNAVLLAIGFVVMLGSEWNGMLGGASNPNKVLASVFQAVSARTAGFATVDWAEANSVTEFVWLALMMIGGASGSAAGGVKITTMAIVFVAVLSAFRGEEESEVFRRRLPAPLLMQAMAVIAAFLLIHFVGTLLLASSEVFVSGSERAFIGLLYETMSAQATVGLSTGITPDLTGAGKLVLCVLMFIGRLGPLTLAYALQLRTQPRRYHYPVRRVRIG